MNETDMSLAEIKSNKEKFLAVYGIEDAFGKGNMRWNDLIEIGEDFAPKGLEDGEYFKIIQEYIAQIASFKNVHSYRYRIKKPGSLLAKIVRKSQGRHEKITVDNYFREITDLLGIRILYIFKEDYWPVHTQIMERYKNQLVEDVRLKLKSADDENTYSEMIEQYNNVKVETNKVYRSIHYTLNACTTEIDKSPKLEIQTRTIFEEGWSEINHMLVYKKGEVVTPSLSKTSGVLSELVGTCDTIGTLMKYIYDEGVHPSINKKDKQQETDILLEEDSVGRAIRKFLLQ